MKKLAVASFIAGEDLCEDEPCCIGTDGKVYSVWKPWRPYHARSTTSNNLVESEQTHDSKQSTEETSTGREDTEEA